MGGGVFWEGSEVKWVVMRRPFTTYVLLMYIFLYSMRKRFERMWWRAVVVNGLSVSHSVNPGGGSGIR